MTNPPSRRLEPDEVLRVMDVARVIQAREERLDRHEALDRDATVREVQVMFEELGDLVDRDVVEAALDQYLAQRWAFTPPPRGPATTLAMAWVKRGVLARRVLAPVAAVGLLAWAGVVGTSALQERALARDGAALAEEVAAATRVREQVAAELQGLAEAGAGEALEGADAAAFARHAAETRGLLARFDDEVGALVDPSTSAADRGELARRRARLDVAVLTLGAASAEVEAARLVVEREQRLGTLAARARDLVSAARETAREPGAADRVDDLAATAERQAADRELAGLRATVDGLSELVRVLEWEYEVVTTGGVWRYPDDDPDVRNHYLIVQAVGPGGEPVRVSIRNEETGRTETVSAWAERVSREVYDRVAADKGDNGIIDDDHFATKRRGWLTLDRVYPDVGQITSWD